MPTKAYMLKKLLCLGGAFLMATVASGDLLSPKLGAPDAITQINSLETKNGISAQFWVTTDDQIFLTWSEGAAIRNLKPTLQVKRNTPVYLALFLANPGVRTVIRTVGKPRYLSDVTFDMYTLNPNGVLTLAYKQRIGWKGTPPAPGLVYLAKNRGVLNFEAIDPLGEYTVVMMVHDNIRKVDIRLVRKLKLVD